MAIRFKQWLALFWHNPAYSAALLRIATGGMFAVAAFHKVMAGTTWPDRMLGFIRFQLDKSGAFYRLFLESVVIPNNVLFAYFVAYAEVFVALSLILGLKSRFGALLGLFLVTNFWLSKGTGFWVPSANDPLYMLVLMALALGNGCDVWSIEKRFRSGKTTQHNH